MKTSLDRADKIPVPKTGEEALSFEFLSKVLFEYPICGVEVVALEMVGVTANTRKVMLKYPEGKESVKFKGVLKEKFSNLNIPKLMVGSLYYRNEVEFYRYCAKRDYNFTKVPYIHYSKIEESGEFCIVMEDLESSDKVFETTTLLCLRNILGEISRLHANFLHKPDPDRRIGSMVSGTTDEFMKSLGLGWLCEEFQFQYHFSNYKKLDLEKGLKTWGEFNEQTLKTVVDRFELYKTKFEECVVKVYEDCHEGFKEELEKIMEMDLIDMFRKSLLNSLNQHYLTIIHGDFRYDNMSCTSEKGVLGFFDWQLVRLGNPLLDFSSICINGLDEKSFAENQESLLKLYYEKLVENFPNEKLKEEVTYQMIIDQYKDALLFETLKTFHFTKTGLGAKDGDDKEKGRKFYMGQIRRLQNLVNAITEYFLK